VKGRVVGHKRGKKIKVFNYHRKTGWKKTRGHRSELTRVEITEIT
jgi:ribosomal protein L21